MGKARQVSVGKPSVIVLAGPNGAGKTTCAPTVLRETLAVSADDITPDSATSSRSTDLWPRHGECTIIRPWAGCVYLLQAKETEPFTFSIRLFGDKSASRTPMSDEHEVDVRALMREGTKIDAAMSEAARQAALRHNQLGFPLVTWRDGQVVEIPPDEIVVPDPERHYSA